MEYDTVYVMTLFYNKELCEDVNWVHLALGRD
jgi:hypothetical protein